MRVVSGCSGEEEETPWMNRTIDGYSCIGGEERRGWRGPVAATTKKRRRVGRGKQGWGLKKRQTPPVLERSLAGPSSPSPNPRHRGVRDGEVMRLGADNDGERRVLSGNGDLNKKRWSLLSWSHSHPRHSKTPILIIIDAGFLLIDNYSRVIGVDFY